MNSKNLARNNQSRLLIYSGMFGKIFVLFAITFAAGQQDEVVRLDRECGLMSPSTGLIQGGHKTERETFPWIVNIFTKYHGVSLYAGSGSLISDRHILCAANSVAYENYLEDSLDLNPDQVINCAKY